MPGLTWNPFAGWSWTPSLDQAGEVVGWEFKPKKPRRNPRKSNAMWLRIYRHRISLGLEHCRLCRKVSTKLVLGHIVAKSRDGSPGMHNRSITCMSCESEYGANTLPVQSLRAEENQAPPHLQWSKIWLNPLQQEILGDPKRGDGHNTKGVSGDCFKTCVASVLRLSHTEVPHFILYTSWWTYLRHWARARGFDFACYYPEDLGAQWEPPPLGLFFIASGPSPRGKFMHSVITDRNLRLMHDPHPSGAGLAGPPQDLIVLTKPYDPEPPGFLMLEAGKCR